MPLQKLILKNFRNHKNAVFSFPQTTVIIGQNTIGKTSILEAVPFLSLGKSFKAEKDETVISENTDFSRIEAKINQNEDKTALTIVLAAKDNRFVKRYLVNGVPRRQGDFTQNFTSVLFTPEDIEIITDSPSLRRNYINNILSKTDRKYRISLGIYEKALRQRNKMLWLLREGKKFFSESDFEYWDNILIENGNVITDLRKQLVEYVNEAQKQVFNFEIFYDHSIISRERLDKYRDAQRASATTLVGPNRDDFVFHFESTKKLISEYGSRGEQRLTIFQMKILETFYIKEHTEQSPTLLLDDIFSELDSTNINRVLNLLPNQQTIITTTHKEFVPGDILEKEDVEIIEL